MSSVKVNASDKVHCWLFTVLCLVFRLFRGGSEFGESHKVLSLSEETMMKL